MKIKITPDQEDWIVRKSLKKTIEILKKSIKATKGTPMQDNKDEALLDSLIDAHNYYSTLAEQI
jgi:hypothetical protein